ncbi:hypothetical protein [Streptomyces sp. 900105245]
MDGSTQRMPGVQLLLHQKPAHLLGGGFQGRPLLRRLQPSAVRRLLLHGGECVASYSGRQGQEGRHDVGLGDPLIEIHQDLAQARRIRWQLVHMFDDRLSS